MKRLVVAGFALLVIVAAAIWFRNFLAVDSCLDNGGRWDYERRECDHDCLLMAVSRPSPSF